VASVKNGFNIFLSGRGRGKEREEKRMLPKVRWASSLATACREKEEKQNLKGKT